jgi:hypothetical protein
MHSISEILETIMENHNTMSPKAFGLGEMKQETYCLCS